jgi:hypothetical protein
MKKWIITLIAALGFATLAQPASAQTYVGPHLGASFAGGFGFGFGGQFGVKNALGQNLGLRGLVTLAPVGVLVINIEGDVVYDLPISSVTGLNLYFGGGPAVGIVLGGGGGFGFGLNLVAGIEYLFTPTISGFFELNPGFTFVPGFFFGFGSRIGANFRI